MVWQKVTYIWRRTKRYLAIPRGQGVSHVPSVKKSTLYAIKSLTTRKKDKKRSHDNDGSSDAGSGEGDTEVRPSQSCWGNQRYITHLSYQQPPIKKKKGLQNLFNVGKKDKQVSNGVLTQDELDLLIVQPPTKKNTSSTQQPLSSTQEPSTSASSQQPSSSSLQQSSKTLQKASVIKISEDEDDHGDVEADSNKVPEEPEELEEDELSQSFISFIKQMLIYFTRTAYERMDRTCLCFFSSGSNNWAWQWVLLSRIWMFCKELSQKSSPLSRQKRHGINWKPTQARKSMLGYRDCRSHNFHQNGEWSLRHTVKVKRWVNSSRICVEGKRKGYLFT